MRNTFTISILLILFAFSLHSQCVLTELVVERSTCDLDDKFDVTLDFDYQDVGDSGFRVQGNGANYGEFDYADLPIVISDLAGDCVTEWEFVIRDIDDPSCAIDGELGKVCCEFPCQVEIVNFEVSECINGGFNMFFSVESDNVISDDVDVFVNGNFEASFPFALDRIRLEDVVPLNDRDNTLVVCDQGDPSCCDTLVFESPCACSIKDIRSRIVECNDMDSTYYLKFDFETNMVSDSFQIGGNGTFFGNFAYADLPLTVGPIDFHADTAYFLVVDQRNTFCFEEIVVDPVDSCNFECIIENASIEVGDCDSEENFYVSLTFDTNNPGINGFTVRGNGVVYGEDFQYGQSSYEIGPLKGDCETIYEFIIRDNEVPDCAAEVFLDEAVCCKSCNISGLVVEAICDDFNVSQLVINFGYEYSLDSIFKLNINNMDAGEFHFNDLPLTLDVDLPNAEEIRVLVQDKNDPENCRAVKEIIPNCGEVPCGEYVDIFTEFGECLEDNSYFIDIEFELVGTHSDSFYIFVGDKQFGPFEHGETFYTVGPIESDCKRTIIKLIDYEREECAQVIEIDEIKCCETCDITEVIAEVVCDGNDMLGFNIKAVGNDKSTKYNFELGDQAFGPYTYGEEHFVEIQLTDGIYTFEIFDVEDPDCFAVVELEVLCEEIIPCDFKDVEVNAINCTEDNFEFLIDFELNQNPSFLFDLSINGEFIGTSSYSLLPISSSKLKREDGGPWIIKITDQDRDCNHIVEIEEELCEVGLFDEVSDEVTIRFEENNIYGSTDSDLGEVNYHLISSVGQKIISGTWNTKEQLFLDINEYQVGIYFFVVEKNGRIKTYKVGKF